MANQIYRGFDVWIGTAEHPKAWFARDAGSTLGPFNTDGEAMSAVDAQKKLRRSCAHPTWAAVDQHRLIDRCTVCGKERA